MAKIVDPDVLALAVNAAATVEEVEIQTDAKTIELHILGDLDDDSPGSTSGVTLQCIYSFLKEEWRTNTTLNKFKFPIKAIYEAKFVMQYGWSWEAQQTRDLIRDAGCLEITGAEHACIISLGSQYDDTQQAWHQQVAGFDQSTTNFDKTGPLDEMVEIFDGGSNDYRDYLKVFLREWERTYSDYEILSEQGFSALTYIAYRAPLANANDIKNDGTVTQATIDGANDPYQDMDLQYYVGQLFTTAAAQAYVANDVVQDGVGRWARCTVAGTIAVPGGAWSSFGGGTWEAYPGERQIGPNYYAFNRAVQYNGVGTLPTKEQIYLFGQNELTKAADINDDPDTDSYGTVNGTVAVQLAYWVGDMLHSWPGVSFDDFNSNDTNSLVLHDITVDGGGLNSEDVPETSTGRQFPFTAAGTMVFSQNLVDEADADTLYRMYHQYTKAQTRTDFTITGVTLADATIETAAGDFDLGVGDYFLVSGFTTNDVNNGVKVATGTPTATAVDYTDALGRTQIADVTLESVTVREKPYDSASAVVVTDNSSSAIEGQISIINETFDFNYDGNVDGGRVAAEDALVVVVAQGLPGAEWVFAEFTITRNTGLSFPVNAPDELTY